MKDVKKLVLTALFAALACVATMIIRIPTPGTGGYIHPGDAIVILCGVYLGPVAGFLAAGMGSALSDLLGGYFLYVPITFAVKGLVALFTAIFYQKIATSKKSRRYAGVAAGGICDIILVAGGYFLCESFLYGVSGALASVIPNTIQGISGLVISIILYAALSAVPEFRRLSMTHKKAA